MTHPIRVMLADDHETVRQGLRALFSAVPEVEVVAEAGDTDSTLGRVRSIALDVIVLDLSMPRAGGLPTIRAIKAEKPQMAVVVLTRYRDRAFVREAFAAGASAYVLKQSPFSELRDAVGLAVRGNRYVDRQLMGGSDEFAGDDATGPLSDREREVLRRTALGQSNKEIASSLGISIKTVEVHKTRGMRKLRLQDRSGLVRLRRWQVG